MNGALQTLEDPDRFPATGALSDARWIGSIGAAVGLGVDSGTTGLTVERVAHVCRENEKG